jgi:hypothetical protein
MGFSSQPGRTIFRTQTVAGTYNTDTGTAGLVGKVLGGAFVANRELLITDPEIGGGRDVSDALLASVSYTAEYNAYLRPDLFALLANAAFGGNAVEEDDPVAGANTVTISTVDSAALPYLSVEECVGGTSTKFDCFRYWDAVVNSLSLETDAKGIAKFSASMVAKRGLAGQTPTADNLVVQDESPLIVASNITLSYNSVLIPVKTFSLEFSNNFDSDDFRLGSFYLGDLTAKRREVTAKFKVREESSALWRQATFGSSVATSPGGLSTKQPLVVTLTGYDMVTGTTPYSITITMPNFVLKPYKINPEGDSIIESDVEGQALRPDTATPAITAVVVTGLTELP